MSMLSQSVSFAASCASHSKRAARSCKNGISKRVRAVGVAALNKKRSCILIEILKENIEKIKNRFDGIFYQTVLE